MSLTCICGHQGPDSARFCANCGRPLVQEVGATPAAAVVGAVDEPLPAPQTGPSWLDRVWDFFASVPVATVLLFLLAAASVLGTLIEQEGQYSSWMPPDQYYPTRYGPFWGHLILATGLSHAYTSWWYLTLMAMVGISLTVCSIQRGVPLYRAIHRPNVAPPPAFLRHMRLRFTYPLPGDGDPLAPLAQSLSRLRYRITRQGDRLLAEQGRWGRWGPYVVHLGLIVILLGGLSRALPGWYYEGFIWVKDGETVPVPGTDWAVHSEKFTAEFYEDGRPRLYATDAVVVQGEQEVLRHQILMNQPLSYQGTELYQSSYQTQLSGAVLTLKEAESGTALGTLTLDLDNPAPSHRVAGHQVDILDYYPDFALDANNQPITRSRYPNNPAFRLQVADPEGQTWGPFWFFLFYPEVHFDASIPYHLAVQDMMETAVTGLRVKRDRGVPIIYLGLFVTTVGVGLTFYLSHRRIWAMVDGQEVLVAGQTNRNRLFFSREFRRLGQSLGAKELSDQHPARR